MCKMSLDWYKLAEAFIAANEGITFARFRAKMIQMESDIESFRSDQGGNTEAAYFRSLGGRIGGAF